MTTDHTVLKGVHFGAVLLALLLPCQSSCVTAQESLPEKRAIFYTTYGYLEGDQWQVPMKIWVYEEPDFARRLVAKVARDKLQARAGIAALTAEQEQRFESRVHGFIADSESRETVLFEFDRDPQRTVYQLFGVDGQARTDRNGLIEGTITLPVARADTLLKAQQSTDGWLSFHAVSEDHAGAGRVRLIGATGTSVISDIDDTIKITGIPDGEAVVLENTFFESFRASPCMPEMYAAFGAEVPLHYVSGGPWQLYAPLAGFIGDGSSAYPQGTFHMKNVRTNPFESESYADIWKLVAAGSGSVTHDQKVAQISTLIRHFPERGFVLIGDSGEHDPEIFAEIRQLFPRNVAEIRIRDVVDDRTRNPARLAGMTIILPEAGADGTCRYAAGQNIARPAG